MSGTGTKDDPWVLKTPPGTSDYTMYRDDAADPPQLVCQVGSTKLAYPASAIDDLHAWRELVERVQDARDVRAEPVVAHEDVAGANDADLIALAGLVNGEIDVRAATEFEGVELLMRHPTRSIHLFGRS